jgi:hypothetical protein
LLGHIDCGDDGVRPVLGVRDGAFRNPSRTCVISERHPSLDQTRAQTGIGAFDETIVERQDVVFFSLDPEQVLHLLQPIGILRGEIICFTEVMLDIV